MQTKRILIVDDAPEFANLVKDALATMQIPLQVTVYLSAEEAWLEALKTRFDLVITDLRLPGISGTELVRRIRQRFPKIKIIAVSGLAEAGLSERTRAAGVDAFYRKPVEMPLLLTKIDNLLSDINPDTTPEPQRAKAPLLSRLVTVPLTAIPEGTEPPPDSVKNNAKYGKEDIATMRDLEQRLHKLQSESSAKGIALSNLTGQILYTHGTATGFTFSKELFDTCASLVESIEKIAHQPEEKTSLGILALNGLTTDIFVVNIEKFFIWLLFPTGTQSVEAGKVTAAVYASRGSLQFILNMLSLLPMPVNPHPPGGKPENQKESMSPKDEDHNLLAKKLEDKQIDKKDAKAFWDDEIGDKEPAQISPETISFDKAASLGLVPNEPPDKKK